MTINSNNERYHDVNHVVAVGGSGGSGHLEAMKREIKHMQDANGDRTSVTTIDIYKSACSFNTYIGEKCTDLWDDAQRSGNIRLQEALIKKQPMSTRLFYYPTYYTILKLLRTPDKHGLLPDLVVVTIPVCIEAVCQAVEDENARRKQKNIQPIKGINLHVMEPPTDGAVYYFTSLSRLKKSQANIVTLYSLDPSKQELEKYDATTKEDYWFAKTGNRFKVVTLAEVDDDYINCQTALPGPGEATKIVLKTQNPDEVAFTTSEARGIHSAEGTFSVDIQAQDQVGLVMLGGVPTQSAILGYVSKAIESAEQVPQDKKSYLFVACGRPKDNTLYPKVIKLVEEFNSSEAAKRSGLHIIPFTGQPVKQIFGRCDFSITRSGGLTAQEIVTLKAAEKQKNKVVYIHGQIESNFSTPYEQELAKQTPNELAHIVLAKRILDQEIALKQATQEELQKAYDGYIQKAGMPLWEADNAEYLHQTVGATPVNHNHIGNIIVSAAQTGQAAPLLSFNPVLLREKILQEEERREQERLSGCCVSTCAPSARPFSPLEDDDSGIGSSVPGSRSVSPAASEEGSQEMAGSSSIEAGSSADDSGYSEGSDDLELAPKVPDPRENSFYNFAITDEQRGHLAFILQHLGNDGVFSLFGLKSELERRGQVLDSTHVLLFLASIFLDPVNSENFSLIKKRDGMIKDPFFKGIKDKLTRLNKEGDLLPHVVGFAHALQLNPAIITDMINKNAWDDLLNHLELRSQEKIPAYIPPAAPAPKKKKKQKAVHEAPLEQKQEAAKPMQQIIEEPVLEEVRAIGDEERLIEDKNSGQAPEIDGIDQASQELVSAIFFKIANSSPTDLLRNIGTLRAQWRAVEKVPPLQLLRYVFTSHKKELEMIAEYKLSVFRTNPKIGPFIKDFASTLQRSAKTHDISSEIEAFSKEFGIDPTLIAQNRWSEVVGILMRQLNDSPALTIENLERFNTASQSKGSKGTSESSFHTAETSFHTAVEARSTFAETETQEFHAEVQKEEDVANASSNEPGAAQEIAAPAPPKDPWMEFNSAMILHLGPELSFLIGKLFPNDIESFSRENAEGIERITVQIHEENTVTITKNVSPAQKMVAKIPATLQAVLTKNRIDFDTNATITGTLQLPLWVKIGFKVQAIEFDENNRTVTIETDRGAIVRKFDKLAEML